MFGKGIQKRVTKLVPRLKHMSYATRLAELRLPTLIYRQRRADMMQVFTDYLEWITLTKTNSLSLMKTDRQEEFNLTLQAQV